MNLLIAFAAFRGGRGFLDGRALSTMAELLLFVYNYFFFLCSPMSYESSLQPGRTGRRQPRSNCRHFCGSYLDHHNHYRCRYWIFRVGTRQNANNHNHPLIFQQLYTPPLYPLMIPPQVLPSRIKSRESFYYSYF